MATFAGSLTLIKEFAGVAVVAGGLIAAAGFGFSAPWAAKADVESVQKIIQTMQSQQAAQISHSDEQQCIIYQLLKDRYLKEQADAQEELNKNPTSFVLQRVRDEAAANVSKINGKLNAEPCV